MPRHARGPAAAAGLRPDPGEPQAPRHAHRHRPHPLLRRTGVAGLGLALFAVTGGVLAYGEMQGNITQHDISDLLGDDRPTAPEPAEESSEPVDRLAGQPINLLVMGSDARVGESDIDGAGEAGVVGGMRSDTTMIAHVSADRSRVDIVSIPRDTLVDIPSCRLPDGSTTEEQSDAMFNSAFQLGGQTGDVGAAAACTIRTVEDLTGIYIDDFVVVDFAGFTHMVDALGGVPMYIPEDVDDPDAGLRLEQGCQVLDGDDALGFARARKSIGDGSDISRIGRQQELVAAIAREALGKNLLTDLPSLYRFLDAATSTLTTGRYIGALPTMAGLANSLRGLEAGGIYFATMPFEWEGPRVRPTEDADELWDAIIADEPIEATLTGTGSAPTEEATTTAPPTTDQPTPTAAPTTEAPTTQAPAAPTATPEPEPTVPVCTK